MNFRYSSKKHQFLFCDCRLLIACVLLAWTPFANAQPYAVHVNIIVPPPYSPYLQDYLQYENKMVIQLQNLTSQTQAVKLIGSVEGDNGIALITNENYQPATPITIPPNSIFRVPASSRSRSFLDPNNLNFVGPENLKTQILKDGLLPEGTYTICLQAVDYETDQFLSEEAPAGCTIIPVSYPTPSEPLFPECESSVSSKLPLFQWTLPGGLTAGAAIQYDLFIIEWLQGSNPQDLVQLAVDYNAGNAIVRRNLTLPSYQYMVTDPKLKDGATYLWVVTAKDRMGRVAFENGGQSEICSFIYQSGEESGTGITSIYNGPRQFEIQQTRTQISGQMKYKFPGGGFGAGILQNRNVQIETEEMPYIINNASRPELENINDQMTALANHDYIDAFPVSEAGSHPLANREIKLMESWVIMDCDVTYYPINRTVHKEFFILPDEYRSPLGGTTLYVHIDGLTNGMEGNALALDTIGLNLSYSRKLAVDRTDNVGNYIFRFTQSTPGLRYNNYPGSATVVLNCEPEDVPKEEHEFVHPLDEHSNPADIYSAQSIVSSNPVDLLNNTSITMPENSVLRMGYPNQPTGQQGYDSIVITGGSLMKVLRLEITSPFYYSPDLIFWTQPGDTVTLPDQVSYVKSFDLDLTLKGGKWQINQNYQSFVEGDGIPGVDVTFSRMKDGLPQAIPMEEGQGLRDYEGESGELWQEQNEFAQEVETSGFELNELYDSVSIVRSNGDGLLRFTKLVAGHPYYLVGSTPEDGDINYVVPFQHKQYEVFYATNCVFNNEARFNSYCEHKPIKISDDITAYPQIPKIFGRVTTGTNDEIAPLPYVKVLLRRFENGTFKNPYITYTNQDGMYRFDNVPVNPSGAPDYKWRLFFEKNGYVDTGRPDNHDSNPDDDVKSLRPGQQWDVPEVEMDPMGHLTGYIRNEDGEMIQSLVRLANGPHLQTSIVSSPAVAQDFCGDVNNFGDQINESTQVTGIWNMGEVNIGQAVQTQAAYFSLPARSGNQLPLVIIPLPEQYFQDTCYVNVDELPNGQFQSLGYITVKEKLHRVSITVRKPDGTPAQASVYIDERVRETNDLGFTAFRFASPETSYRVRIDPDLPTLVPVDTIMHLPISKTYLQHTFHLREGKKIKVRAIVDYSGSQQQPANPVPIEGAVVQTLLTASQNGHSYISCITGADGTCTLEGVPASPTMAEISVWKEDDERLYIGKTVSANVNRPLNPPLDVALKTLSGVTMPDIWGFPAAVTDMDIKHGADGKLDTLFTGILTALPSNNRFKTADDAVQIPYPKIKFVATGQRDDAGRKIMQPATSTGFSLLQNSVSTVLYDEFNVTLSPKRDAVYADLPFLHLKKTEGYHAKITGVVETELSSFNFSYNYTGKFFLGKTPTEYNIDVFQTGMNTYTIYNTPGLQLAGQDPEPGPDDFYLMDIGPQNKPRSHAYQVFQFEATSDSSRSFVTPHAFYIHTILHTDIPDVTPRDLKLSVGKIVVTKEEVETLDNGSRMLDFKMGKYWRYYSTTPYRYDYNLGGITASNGFINTGQIDVPVRDPIIKPKKLYMNDIDDIEQLTLAGIKDLPVEPNVNISLSKGFQNKGWILRVQKRDADNNIIPDAIVAKLTGLPAPLKTTEVINIYSIQLSSEKTNLDLDLSGKVRPHDICDLTVQGITTGPDFFMLTGEAELGRTNVRVPNLPTSLMNVLYKGPKHALSGRISSEYAGNLRTAGDVGFVFDYSDAGTTRQHYSDRRYVTTGTFTVSDKSGNYNFKLKGILELDYDAVRIHVITDELNIANLEYAHVDQPIELGTNGKQMLVRSGIQRASGNTWQHLTFDANMVGFTGVKPNQSPMTFVVDGPVSANDEEVSIDGIDFGFAEIKITYNFAKQSFNGDMDVDFSPARVSMGPVSVESISADILIDPQGFLFAASIYGYVLEMFDASFGLLIGAHSEIPTEFVNTVMQHAKNKQLPQAYADGSIAGFFITGNVYLLNEEMPEINFLELFVIEGSVEVGVDARFYMNFESGNAAFGFGVLVYADAGVSVTIIGTCPDPVFSLYAGFQLLLEGEVHQNGGDWIVEGRGCGSMVFGVSACLIDEEVGGFAELIISSEDGISANAGLDGQCVETN